MTLSQLFNTAEWTDTGLCVDIPDCWMQGRSAYGGLQAALAAEAMQRLSDGLPIRTLQATLIEPVSGTINCEAQLIRSSKNTRQIEVRLTKAGQTHAIFVGIFGRARDSIVQWTRPRTVPAEQEQVWPFIDGASPQFMQNFAICLRKGHPIASGHPDTEHLYRLSLKDDTERSELRHILALVDFPPPLGMTWPTTFTPGSTMTWMLNFTGEPVTDHPLEDWECEVILDAAREGYTHQTVSLYAPNGTLIARGTQCMVVFG